MTGGQPEDASNSQQGHTPQASGQDDRFQISRTAWYGSCSLDGNLACILDDGCGYLLGLSGRKRCAARWYGCGGCGQGAGWGAGTGGGGGLGSRWGGGWRLQDGINPQQLNRFTTP